MPSPPKPPPEHQLLRHNAFLKSLALSLLNDEHLADDVVQATWVAALENQEPPARSWYAWMRAVTRNLAIKLRHRRQRAQIHEAALPTPEIGLPPDQTLAHEEVLRAVTDAVLALDEPERATVLMRYYEGLMPHEIATKTGVPVATVKSRIHRSLRRLRQRLDRHAGDRGAWGVGLAALTGNEQWLGSLPAHSTVAANLGPLIPGSMLMHAKTKLTLIAGVVTLAAGAAVFGLSEDQPGGSPRGQGGTLTSDRDAGRNARNEMSAVQDALDTSQEKTATPDPTGRKQIGAVGAKGAKRSDKSQNATAVSGTVRTARGDVPVQGATIGVVIHGKSYRRGWMSTDEIRESRTHQTTTDAKGGYVFEQLTTFGRATISAYRDGSAGAQVAVTIAEGKHVRAPDLKLRPGKTLRGQVQAIGGGAVPNAIVTVMRAYDAKDYTRGWGFAVTNEHGDFALGLHADAALCTLRVNSDDHGQDFFLKVKTDSFAVLKIKARAILRGRITLPGGRPAVGVAVLARTELPEPAISIVYSGLHPRLTHSAEVGEDGRYEIRDLQPGLSYAPVVVESSDKAEHWPKALTPDGEDCFKPNPGEVRKWDATVAAKITVRGRVKTEQLGRPVANVMVQVAKDGKLLWQSVGHTDADGRFELRLTTGPGSYRFHADVGDKLASNRLAVEKEIREEDRELAIGLLAPEPIVLPIRVVDSNGKPVRSIQSTLHVVSKGRRRGSIGTSRTLDDQGRTRILIYRDVSELQLEVSKFPRGPRTTTSKIGCKRIDVLPEQQITLHAASGIAGRLVDKYGNPRANQSLQVSARYDDGTHDRFYCKSGEDGRFSQTGACRAAHTVFVVAGDGKSWRSDRVLAPVDGTIDLGVVRLR